MRPKFITEPPLTASAKSPPVPCKKLPLPPNWREMRAREVFDLRRPLLDQLPPPDELPPELRKLVEEAERYKRELPEYRYPELLKADEAAHTSVLPERRARSAASGLGTLRAEHRSVGCARLRRCVAPEV